MISFYSKFSNFKDHALHGSMKGACLIHVVRLNNMSKDMEEGHTTCYLFLGQGNYGSLHFLIEFAAVVEDVVAKAGRR